MRVNNQMLNTNSIRLIGLLYLLVIILAGFSQGYVRGSLFVPGDSISTASNILANESLFRIGLSTDLIAFIIDAIISVMLYFVFRPFDKKLAMISSALRLIAHPAIGSLNLLNHYLALEVMKGGEYLNVFGPEQLESLSLLFMEAHRYGYLIAGGFFGLHCLLFGILIYRSNVFPKVLGGFLFGSAAGYLLETFGDFTLPGNEATLALIVGVAAAIGEVGITIYMLSIGTNKDYKKELRNIK